MLSICTHTRSRLLSPLVDSGMLCCSLFQTSTKCCFSSLMQYNLFLFILSQTHTHTHDHFMAHWILSGTTLVSRYQKEHSPTHTYRGTSFIPYLLPPSITIHGILYVQFTCLTMFFPQPLQISVQSTSWPGTLHFITSAEEGGYVFGLVCLSVCLSVCPSDYSQTCEWILTKFFGGVGHGSRTK